MAKNYLRQYCFISIGDPGSGKKDIRQLVEFLPEGGKKQRLQAILHTHREEKSIVFINNRSGVDAL